MAKVQRFRAMLEPDGTSLKWVIARVPFDVSETWTEMIRQRVRGTISAKGVEGKGTEFRTSLFPDARMPGRHVVLVNKTMQRAAGVSSGAMAEFTLEPDLEPRPAELPEELEAILDGEDELRAYYDELSESMRRELGKWVHGVKSADARVRRAEELAERLMSSMEGERETPPALEAAFRARPKARKGWEAMTLAQRRGHLLGIFFYKSPESRAKRMEKALDDAESRISKRESNA